MSTQPRGPRIEIPPLAVGAVIFLVALGFYPLPSLIPNFAGLRSANVRFWVGASLLTLGPVLALATLKLSWLRALPGLAMRALRRPPPVAFAILVAAAFTGLSLWLAWYAFGFAPTTADEIAQLWHANILLHGRLVLPPDPNAQFFAVDNVISRGAWYSQFPIGGPAVLALGLLVGAPWLVNPLLGGLTAAALYQFARRAYGESQARAAAVLFALTPVTLLMSASYMNHVPVLLLAVVALMLLAEWERAPGRGARMWCAAGTGLAVGLAACIRPLDALVVAAVIGIFQVATVRGDRARWRELGVEIAAGLLGVAPLLLANWGTTGAPFHFAYEVLWGPGHRLGFHVDPQGVRHTPFRALVLAAKYVNELNAYMMGWTLPTLLVAIVGLVSLRRTSRWDALLFGWFGAQVVAYALYWHDGEFLGPRFLYTVLPVLVIVLARTPFLVAARWGGYWRHAAPLAMLTLVGVAWLVPMNPYGARGLVQQVRQARATFKVNLGSAVRAAGVHHAVVFVHEPFSGRLTRRLWGLGVSRTAAAELMQSADACSLLSAVEAGEANPALTPAELAARVATYAPGAAPIRALDPNVHISSEASLTPSCKAELALDARYPSLPFGVGLLQEAIQPDGRLGGDVVYAADLGERNDVLRARFADRTWYRAWTERAPDGSIVARVGAY